MHIDDIIHIFVFLYCYKTNRFHVAIQLFSNSSQKRPKCGKNISDTQWTQWFEMLPVYLLISGKKPLMRVADNRQENPIVSNSEFINLNILMRFALAVTHGTSVTLYHVTVIVLLAFDCYVIQRSRMNSCLAYAINRVFNMDVLSLLLMA